MIPTRWTKALAVSVSLIVPSVLSSVGDAHATLPDQQVDVIVTYAEGVDVNAESRLLLSKGAIVTQVYTDALTGVAASMQPADVDMLSRDPRVLSVARDDIVRISDTPDQPPLGTGPPRSTSIAAHANVRLFHAWHCGYRFRH